MSYRNDNLASYDHTLLSSVPGPTRAEKQEGYNVGLLEDSRDRGDPSPPANGTASEHHGGVLDYSPGAVSYARKEDPPTTNDYEPVDKRVPWYRTRKGIIGIVVAILVIIAAAVGGGVGGTRHSSHSTHNSSGNIGQSGSNGTEQGAASSASPTSSGIPGLTQGVATTTESPGSHGRRGVA